MRNIRTKQISTKPTQNETTLCLSTCVSFVYSNGLTVSADTKTIRYTNTNYIYNLYNMQFLVMCF